MKVHDTKDIKPLRESSVREPGGMDRAARREPLRAEERVDLQESTELRATVEEARRVAGLTRAADLESLKAAIKSGSYRPDPNRIANEILEAAAINASLRALLMR